MSTEFVKEKLGKIRWEIFPWSECTDVVRVFEYGEDKYGAPYLYRSKEAKEVLHQHDFIAAIFRHAIQILDKNESHDAESGCLHFAHIAANALMAISLQENKE